MLSTHRKECYGTLDTPVNDSTTPSSLTVAVAVALFYNEKRMKAEQVGTITADLIALTHGNPETILSGVVLAYALAGILQEPEQDLATQFRQAIAVMQGQFGSRFPQAEGLAQYLHMIIDLALEGEQFPQAGMEQMRCLDADQCLAGAMFAALTCPEDFDTGVITAVNHSGVSTAVGAIAGAILGAKLGEEALPEFYLESLECGKALRVLATDMVSATPALGLFDETWDDKYAHGNVPAL
jgi:ADP-ribosylglycohydrolase